MLKRLAICVLLVASASYTGYTGLAGAERDTYRNTYNAAPTTNDGKKWRIGYYQGGDSLDYYNALFALAQGLMELGWVEDASLPEPQGRETKPLWDWLASEAKSDYLLFVPDAHYGADWNSDLRPSVRADIIDRLNSQKDLDFMVVLGTWAGQDLANNEHSVPMTIMNSSDAVGSGIVKTAEDSGYDHVHAHLDQHRYERQIRLFHGMVGFKKLGISYEDTVAGRSYAAINVIKELAGELGFDVVPCFTQSDIPNVDKAGESVIGCFNELAGRVDAIYITVQQGVNASTLPELVDICTVNNIPTFSQSGSTEVKHGVLLSMGSAQMTSVGRFHAVVMGNVFNGIAPRKLEQVFEARPNIAINLKTAELIGFIPHADMLAGADEIYLEIQGPK